MASTQSKPAPKGQGPTKESLSEIRTTVLGLQILLGFQYQAVFQPAFASFAPWRRDVEVVALALLVLTIALLIAPASYHQISERGERTQAQTVFDQRVLVLSLAPFALATGSSILVAVSDELGVGAALVAAAGAAMAALFLWYGVELMAKRASRPRQSTAAASASSIKDRLEDIMTETRIVLPGVQALLGFQFAAYLTAGFAKLPGDVRAAHDGGLALLLLSMLLLMTPAPFHRIANQGVDTERAHRVGAALVLAALLALALGVTADFYVAAFAALKQRSHAAVGAAGVIVVLLAAWFVVPLVGRAAGKQTPARSAER